MSVIGTLTVDLVANTAAFSGDLGKAAKSAEDFGAAAAGAGEAVDVNMREARGSLMLMGDEFGVHLPREIRTMIAEVPGVGAALEALLPIMGAVFAVSMIYEWVEAHEKAAAEVQAAWDKSANTTRDTFDKLGDKLLEVGIKSDELAGNHLAALNKQLLLIDRQTMSGIISELDKMGKSADDAFAKMQSNWFMQLMIGKADMSPMRAELQDMLGELDKLKGTGVDPGNATRALLGTDIDHVKGEIDGLEAKMKEYRAIQAAPGATAEDLAGADAQLKKLQQRKEGEQQVLAILQKGRDMAAESVEAGTGEKKNDTTKEAQNEEKNLRDHQVKMLGLYAKGRGEIAATLNEQWKEESKINDFRLSESEKQEKKAADDKVETAKQSAKEMEEANKILTEEVVKFDKMQEEAAKKKAETIEKAEQRMADAVAKNVAKSIVENKSLTQSFRQTGSEILEAILENMLRQNAAADIQQLKDAGHAASATYAHVMETVPPPFAFPMAVAEAAGAFAGVMAFHEGGVVPGSGDVPIMAQGGETVVSKALTEQVQGNRGGGAGHTINVTHHIHTMDAEGFERVLAKNASAVQRHVRGELRKMNQ